jgi:hypothetical protein
MGGGSVAELPLCRNVGGGALPERDKGRPGTSFQSVACSMFAYGAFVTAALAEARGAFVFGLLTGLAGPGTDVRSMT